MPTKLIFAAIASLLFAAQAGAEAPSPRKVNAILCETEDQAVALASNLAAGETEPMAVNAVNKVARAEVCGRYIGYAVIEIERTENRNGTLYMLIGLRFGRDDRLTWTASWVTPFNSLDLTRGT